jgi:hypothetical protein
MKILDGFKLAARLHAGQVDKAGRPYIEHLVRVFLGVLERGGNRFQQLAALLHDAVEDKRTTYELLLAEGVPPETIGMLKVLSKPEGMPYEEYMGHVKQHPEVLPIKESDLDDNSDEDRLALLEPALAARLRAKYKRAREILAA